MGNLEGLKNKNAEISMTLKNYEGLERLSKFPAGHVFESHLRYQKKSRFNGIFCYLIIIYLNMVF